MIENETMMPLQIEELCVAWKKQFENSRKVVLDELVDMQVGWDQGSYDDATREDAKTLDIVIKILDCLNC